MSGLWEELKTRKIFRTATIYAALAWGIIQIADILLPVLGIADWVMSSMVLLAFSGFPVVLIVSWMLDLQQERLAQSESQKVTKSSLALRLTELAIIGAFGIGASYLYYQSSPEPTQPAANELTHVNRLLNSSNARKTIAVLPFVSFSDSSDDEFFADGLSEELLNVLARNKKLRVAARTSSFEYKNTNINIKKIAAELGVEYILEGSVRRAGELIRVTAQLIKADEDSHVFSRAWDRSVDNIFKVQDEIAQLVLSELKVNLFGENKSEPAPIGTENIAAFAEYSRGLALLRNRSKSDFTAAIARFSKALELDPDYAQAMAMQAQAYLLQFSYQLVEFEDIYLQAKKLINKALELNPELGGAHAVKGLMYWQLADKSKQPEAELAQARQHLVRAIEINPSLAEAYMWYGTILQQQGDFTDGARLRQKAFEIDPRAAVAGYNRAEDLIRYGEYKQAMDVFNTVVRNNPSYPNAYSIAGNVSFAVGQLDQAYSMYRRLADLSDDDMDWLVNSTRIYIPMQQFHLAQKNIDQLKQSRPKKFADKYSWLQASIWVASDNYKALNEWIRGFEEETKRYNERFWRGFSSLKKQKWQFAIEDLTQALDLIRAKNSQRVDEKTIQLQLLIARAYQALGNSLKSTDFLSRVIAETEQLKNQGFDSQEIRYLEASTAALKGNTAQATALLRQSVLEGLVDFWWADADPVFDQARQLPGYRVIRDEFYIRMKLMQNSIDSQYSLLAQAT